MKSEILFRQKLKVFTLFGTFTYCCATDISYGMKTLKCKDMDPSSTCEYMATGNTDEEVMQNMAAHVKEAHADKVGGMTEQEAQDMMRPHIKEE